VSSTFCFLFFLFYFARVSPYFPFFCFFFILVCNFALSHEPHTFLVGRALLDFSLFLRGAFTPRDRAGLLFFSFFDRTTHFQPSLFLTRAKVLFFIASPTYFSPFRGSRRLFVYPIHTITFFLLCLVVGFFRPGGPSAPTRDHSCPLRSLSRPKSSPSTGFCSPVPPPPCFLSPSPPPRFLARTSMVPNLFFPPSSLF